jgi:hypothetical protein
MTWNVFLDKGRGYGRRWACSSETVAQRRVRALCDLHLNGVLRYTVNRDERTYTVDASEFYAEASKRWDEAWESRRTRA